MPEAEKLYDIETLIQTHNADPEFINHIISLFIKNVPETNTKLLQACKDGNREMINFYAHKLKSSIDLFNLQPLKPIIRSIEIKLKTASNADGIAEDVHFVSDYIEKCVREMKKDFKKE